MALTLSEQQLHFTTARLACEPLRREHAQRLLPGLSDPLLYRFIPDDPPSLEALQKRYQRLETRLSGDGSESWLNWALRRVDGEEYVGSLQASVLPDQRAYIAYFVFVPFQRQGFAREACAGLIAFLAQHGVRTIQTEIDTRNAASIALMGSLGFVVEKEKKDADFFKGATSDEYGFRLELDQA